MKLRRGLRVALSCVLVFALLAVGCSNSADDSKGDDKKGKKGEPVELVWYTVGTPQKDVDKVMEEVNKYTKEKINATVKMKMVDWGDYTEKMQVMAASGEPFDIVFTSSWAFDYVQNARKGAFLPINDLLDKYGKGIKDVLHPSFLEGTQVDGKNYGVPANKELPAQSVWRFNKQYLDKYDLDISDVQSLESLEPLLKAFKEKEPSIPPISADKTFTPDIPYDYLIEGLPLGVKLDTKDYKLVNLFETPEVKQTLETMHKYYKAGYLPKDVATLTGGDAMETGKWLVDRVHYQPYAENGWKNSLGYEVVTKPINDPVTYTWSVTGSLQAISATSKHPEKAMEFLNLLNTDEYLRNLVDSGIEGEHYEKVKGDRVKDLPAGKNYDMPSFTLGNMMITYLTEDDPDDKWDQFDKFNESATDAPLLGFNFDPANVSTELAAVNNVKDEYWAALMTGSVDPKEYLPKASKKFKEAGLDKIMEEAQKQIDEWRASQK
ncbi:ABC transporter substrate-binding protein [Numidum massiliense]|uniref:ABC transporter substrate-binding protein n=1 Tax=Numidum massiliense TaxID=1522315 RepID=UPI0006D5A6FE|nr:ABC transporter substrate-binding protein [Numidum massiliense]